MSGPAQGQAQPAQGDAGPAETEEWNQLARARPALRFASSLAAPAAAAGVAACARFLGWRGVDYAAQVFRTDSFRAHGFGLWNLQWYGGNWTLDYSMIFPALASFLGFTAVSVCSAAGAAFAFDRLARAHFGRAGWPASLVFAVGTLVPVAIGQLPFLAGEALGLLAVLASFRRRWAAASMLALAATMCSPLAGSFVMIAIAAWVVTRRRRRTAGATAQPASRRRGVVPRGFAAARRTAAAATGGRGAVVGGILVLLAAGTPIAASALLFPGAGVMPYPSLDYLWEICVAAALWLFAGREEPVLRAGLAIYAAAATLAVLVPSPVGGNIGRLGDVCAVPLAVALLWRKRRLLLPVVVVPLVLSQWTPAWSAMTSAPSQPSTQASYFAPLVRALERYSAGGPAGRVEVVPTEFHWEAVYVASAIPLARGWERQLDEADNPIFYQRGALTPASYREWLLSNGVRFVALPDAPLDLAGAAEGKLVSSGRVPGLRLMWRSWDWSLYGVQGSSGIVSGPARLVSATGSDIVVDSPVPGNVVVRVRYNPDWRLDTGAGCVARAPGSWISVDVPRPELFTLGLSIFGDKTGCDVISLGDEGPFSAPMLSGLAPR